MDGMNYFKSRSEKLPLMRQNFITLALEKMGKAAESMLPNEYELDQAFKKSQGKPYDKEGFDSYNKKMKKILVIP